MKVMLKGKDLMNRLKWMEDLNVKNASKHREKIITKLLKDLQKEANQIERQKKELLRQRDEARAWKASARRKYRRMKRMLENNGIEVPANLATLP